MTTQAQAEISTS